MTQLSQEQIAIAAASPAIPNGGISRKLSDDVGDEHHDRGLDRRRGVLPRVEARGQHLDQHIGGKAE